MLPPFLTRPVRRLSADGALAEAGPREAALGRPTVLLARGLCRFERFRAPAGLSRSAALAAARLHARTRAPYALPASALARRGSEFGVWWWDAGGVAALLQAAGLAEPVRLRPEAAGQAAGEGWRVLRGPDGWEAQRWEDGFLQQSAWRRSPFDAAAWSGFARVAPVEAGPPPSAPPAATAAIYTGGSAYRARFVHEHELRTLGPPLALAAAALSLGLSAFFVGQGVTLARRDGALRRAVAVREAAPAVSRRPELAARARGLAALAAVVDRPGPLVRLEEARARLSRFGLKVTGFDARPGELAVTTSASAVAGVDLLAEELESSPGLRDVRPSLDRETRRLTLRMRTAD